MTRSPSHSTRSYLLPQISPSPSLFLVPALAPFRVLLEAHQVARSLIQSACALLSNQHDAGSVENVAARNRVLGVAFEFEFESARLHMIVSGASEGPLWVC